LTAFRVSRPVASIIQIGYELKLGFSRTMVKLRNSCTAHLYFSRERRGAGCGDPFTATPKYDLVVGDEDRTRA
jgi:hypothetical protein